MVMLYVVSSANVGTASTSAIISASRNVKIRFIVISSLFYCLLLLEIICLRVAFAASGGESYLSAMADTRRDPLW